MRDEEEQSPIEAKRVGEHIAEEAEQLAKDQARRKAYLASEQAIEKELKARGTKRSEKRAAEETEQPAKDQARGKAYLAGEQAIAEAQEAEEQPPE
ncbi:MAG: hypothetical protein A2Y91_07125 [Chloroflexi bacterium RBG_13_54_8]|nr:MAG: hypothetical protein A2Y91_07125 [Chloroflexi bacterium RBG_13_54_8]